MTPQEAIAKAQTELNQHREEWEQRFIQYMSQTVANRDKIKERRKKFHKWANLSVYSTIGNAKDNKPVFDLRYQGQSVGSIVIRGNDVRLVISEKQHKNSSNPKYFNGYPKELSAGDFSWHDKEAKLFRKFFQNKPEKKHHPEHRLENLLLKEFSKASRAEKSLAGIQPVTLGGDIFFQLPTPLTASGSDIQYSNGHGGIDILARRKKHLVVFELKDEYKATENPNKVISQAIAYATFIAELCKTEAADDFWSLCRIKDPCNRNYIFVSVLMPDPKDGSKPFTGEEVSIPGSNIKLKLHYMFFDKETIEITDSSL